MERRKLSIKFKEHSLKQSSISSEISELIDGIKTLQKEKYLFWEETVGRKISKVAVPVKEKKGVLFIKVQDSIWRFELVRRKDELIAKINEHLKKNSIKDIVFI
jgi:hypothetical protein